MKKLVLLFPLCCLIACANTVIPEADKQSITPAGDLSETAQTPASNTNKKPMPQPCTTSHYRQFDFWIGEWTVTTPDGKYAGKNSIQPILNGCALYESWTGASGYRGDSLNFYDTSRGVWHQTWIDFAGGPLYGDGGLVDGSMVLSGSGKDRKGNNITNRITWTPNADGSVRQHWEVSSDAQASWNTVFDGLYKKTEQ